jgi:predicted ATPase/class 3 adenylate cyclase
MSDERPFRPETLTFLFTDIEGSTRLLQHLGSERYRGVLADHLALIRDACRARDGTEFGSEGDALFVSFPSATRAVAAAVDAQRSLAGHGWPDGLAVRVRMGLHTGEATRSADGFVGIDVHRAARISAAGHGGQVLLSQTTRELTINALPDGATLRDLGEFRLKDLARPEHLYQVSIEGLAADFPPLRSLDAVPNNLPTQLTSFVGREREVADATGLLEGSRLLTLTGPGGTGKTRLSLQLAAAVADGFRDGAFFVALAPIREPALVASTIAQVLGVQEATARRPVDALADYLRDRHVLLVLDNFEQVLPAAADVAELLRAAPGVKIIVSSRAALRVSGEQEFPVPPLALPDRAHLPDVEHLSQYEAVALFIERAVAVKPDFAVTNANAPAVAEICTRLDGLPLAIELAAARVKLLPPEAMLTRLARRLELLGGGARDLPDRQRTLRGAIDWSYELLDPAARQLLARFSVFAGGATLEAAGSICGSADEPGLDVLEGLSALVEQSLVRQVESEGEPRFWMLETIREFAAERLAASAEADEIARRHAGYFDVLAGRAAPELTGPRQNAWLDRLEQEHDNLRAALAWAIDHGEPGMAMRLAANLWRFWQMRGHLVEGADRLDRLLAMPDPAVEPMLRARALEAAGGIAYWRSDMAAAQAWYEDALAIARAHGSRLDVANALYNLAFPLIVNARDLPRGHALLEESIATSRELDDPVAIARGLWALGNSMYFGGDHARARGVLGESVTHFRATEDRFGLAWALHTYGLALDRLGDLEGARTSWLEALELFESAGDSTGIAVLLGDFSTLAIQVADMPRAIRLAGAASSLATSSGAALTTLVDEMEGREYVREIDDGDPAAVAAWAEGQAMSPERAIAYARQASTAAAAPAEPSRPI